MKRRERTRHLIELGGLIVKAGIVELVDDDRAVILGMLVEAAAMLQGERQDEQLALARQGLYDPKSVRFGGGAAGPDPNSIQI